MERRLTAILAADVVGYSRLMELDEAGTLAVLKAHRQELIDPVVSEHHGRIVKLMGDGTLVEFASVVDAVTCAVAIQAGMAARNSGTPEDRRIELRIGVHMGDIIVEGEDIYGEGVNVAARLEGLAKPGGICISDMVHQNISTKLDLNFEDLGEQALKNIERKVRVWHWAVNASASAKGSTSVPQHLTLPDKPSIAVLPFDNMSGDAEQDYFADGITEEIITELSRFQSLQVIARNSAFTYKGKAVTTQQIGRELGVEYVVEGSVRRSGDRVRLTVQLVEATSGKQIWAESYDRQLIDIFELQDELTRAVVATLPGRIESADVERIRRSKPRDMSVYESLLRAKLLHHRGTREDNAKALELLNDVIEVDPEYAAAYAWKACIIGQAWARGYLLETEQTYFELLNEVQKGYSIDKNDLECIRILCEFHIELKQWDEAQLFQDKGHKLNPNDPRILAQRGELLTWMGRSAEGLPWIEQAMLLDPYEADTFAHLLGRTLFGLERYEDAVPAFMRAPAGQYANQAYLAACFAHMEMPERAAARAADVVRLKEDFTAKAFVAALFYEEENDEVRLLEGLLKAGLPLE
jgi:adenylate cyclase